jgi:4-amino-4-deoxy-L-arabinose transferase-like glycosyltransferase
MFERMVRSPLFYIFLFALLLRTYHLNSIPNGFHVDEVKVGWNAYSILKTGADDWGNKWQLYYNSFGDFRPSGIIYLDIPFVALFGLHEWVVRLPASLFGALLIVPIYFFTLLTTKKKTIALLSAFFSTISPWSIDLSRATSEAIIAVFLVLCGLCFLVKYIQSTRKSFLLFAFCFLFSSYFFYHSARLLVPLLVVSIIYFYRNSIASIKKSVLIATSILLISTIFFATIGESKERFSQVSIFNDLNIKTMRDQLPFEDGANNVFTARVFHNKYMLYSIELVQQYTKYFSPDFLIGDAGNPLRYTTVGNGVLMFVELFLFILGIGMVLKNKLNSLPMYLLLLAPLPAALTTEDVPNMSRAAFMIPFISVLVAYGFVSLTRLRWKFIVSILLLINSIYFFHMYFIHNKNHEPIPLNRNVGTKQVIDEIMKVKDQYDIIYLTNIPDSLYPWFAFYTKPNPKDFNELAKKRDDGAWQFENIIFGQIKCPTKDVNEKDYPGKKILFVDAEGCDLNPETVKHNKLVEIKRTQGGTAYTLWTN